MRTRLPFSYHLKNLIRFPNTGLIILVTVLSGISQSFGLALFLPILKLLNDNDAELPFPFSIFAEIFAYLNVPLNVSTLLVATTILVTVGFALALVQRSLVLAYALPQCERKINHELFSAVAHSSWPNIATLSTGEITNYLLQEVFRACRALTHLAGAVASLIQLCVFLVFSLYLSPELLLLGICFAVLIILIVRPLQRRSYRLGQQLTEANRKFGFHVVDYLSNMKLIKATAIEEITAKRLDEFMGDRTLTFSQRQLTFNITHFIMQAVPVFMVVCAIWLGSQVLKIDPEALLVFLIFMARIAPLGSQCQQEIQSYVMELPAVQTIDQALSSYEEFHEDLIPTVGELRAFNNEIRLDRVSFKFPDENIPVLENVDLTIRSGEMIAIVGASGGGKSTLVDLLCGLRQPSQGRVLVDGHDINQMTPSSWRRQIGYVTQDISIFNESLRNNITLSNPESRDEEIWKTLDLAYLKEFVESMSDGLDSILGEDGVRLSGGQKQRLALARAILGSPRLLVLDEATSALDNESERVIQKAIESLAKGLTIVVVAHRLSTVRNADRIIVLEKGAIVEEGTYDELQRLNGRFSSLHDLQFS